MRCWNMLISLTDLLARRDHGPRSLRQAGIFVIALGNSVALDPWNISLDSKETWLFYICRFVGVVFWTRSKIGKFVNTALKLDVRNFLLFERTVFSGSHGLLWKIGEFLMRTHHFWDRQTAVWCCMWGFLSLGAIATVATQQLHAPCGVHVSLPFLSYRHQFGDCILAQGCWSSRKSSTTSNCGRTTQTIPASHPVIQCDDMVKLFGFWLDSCDLHEIHSNDVSCRTLRISAV